METLGDFCAARIQLMHVGCDPWQPFRRLSEKNKLPPQYEKLNILNLACDHVRPTVADLFFHALLLETVVQKRERSKKRWDQNPWYRGCTPAVLLNERIQNFHGRPQSHGRSVSRPLIKVCRFMLRGKIHLPEISVNRGRTFPLTESSILFHKEKISYQWLNSQL